jgi:hypothetical protein
MIYLATIDIVSKVIYSRSIVFEKVVKCLCTDIYDKPQGVIYFIVQNVTLNTDRTDPHDPNHDVYNDDFIVKIPVIS